ncbi:MAG: hypothetical protein AAF916_12355 [Planctomycetota bacterium]
MTQPEPQSDAHREDLLAKADKAFAELGEHLLAQQSRGEIDLINRDNDSDQDRTKHQSDTEAA